MFNNKQTLINRDIAVSQSKYSSFELVKFIRVHLGLNPLKVVLSWLSLRITHRISFNEYILYSLYDPNLTRDKKRRFISETSQYWVRIFEIVGLEPHVIGNKTLIYEFLDENNIPVPKTHCIIYRKPPSSISNIFIKNEKELYTFLKNQRENRLFGKLNYGLQSWGAFMITGYTEDTITLKGATPMSYKTFFKKIIGKELYLIQGFIENHTALKQFTPHTCTVRTYNIIRENSICTPFMLIKIPTQDNVADNFWRKGNIIAAINSKTGIIERAVQKNGPSLQEIDEHPDTNQPLLGFSIPFWKEVLEINKKTAHLCKELRYQALDIAVTDKGPVIIEVNNNGSFLLPQAAFGTGFLTDEVLDFINKKNFNRPHNYQITSKK